MPSIIIDLEDLPGTLANKYLFPSSLPGSVLHSFLELVQAIKSSSHTFKGQGCFETNNNYGCNFVYDNFARASDETVSRQSILPGICATARERHNIKGSHTGGGGGV